MMSAKTLITSLGILLAIAGCQRTPPPPTTIFVTSPGGHLRTGWRRPLVHSEFEHFYISELQVSDEDPTEFNNLVGLVFRGLAPIRRLVLDTMLLDDYLLGAEQGLLGPDAPGGRQALMVYHIRRDLEGMPVAEGMTLSLGSELERTEEGIYFQMLHVRMEDLITDGAVDGRPDLIQIVIDSNAPTLGCLEVLIESRPAFTGEPLYTYTISRLYDSLPTSREPEVRHEGRENAEIANWYIENIWNPFRGETFTELCAQNPQGFLLPGEFIRLARLPEEIPAGTNFPPPESSP
ncbi:hypothetical protein JXA47_13905 [Candidatus Sumerlaeota bacterium]|nr:hypothetical protein [Candidatus Sumerlaeota bacterium]